VQSPLLSSTHTATLPAIKILLPTHLLPDPKLLEPCFGHPRKSLAEFFRANSLLHIVSRAACGSRKAEEWKSRRAEEQKSRRAEKQKSGRAEEQKSRRAEEQKSRRAEEQKSGRVEEWKEWKSRRAEEWKSGRKRNEIGAQVHRELMS
jgi:hypothetical protein